jgi:hypothetical protein
MPSIKKRLTSLQNQGTSWFEKFEAKVDVFRQDVFRAFILDGYIFLITATGNSITAPIEIVATVLDENFSQIPVKLDSSDLKLVNAYVKVLNLISSGRLPDADPDLTSKIIQVLESRYFNTNNNTP